MKKTIVLFLVFITLFTLSLPAFADDGDTAPVTLNWISARRAIVQAGLNGSYYEIPDFGMDIWIPDLLTPQDDISPDFYYDFADESNTAHVVVHNVEVEGDTSLSAIEETITELGYEVDGVFWINGYSAVIYEKEENDSIFVVIPFDDGDVIEFGFTPKSSQDFYSLASIIMSTIQPHTLSVEDVALMIDADLNTNWGPNRKVRYVGDQDEPSITVLLWDEGVTADTIIESGSWETVRESKIVLYNSYIDVLTEFHMNDVLLTLMYINPDEDTSFLTISGGEIEYDFAE